MENNKKISFFARMISSITDFRIYPFVEKEKVTTAISYFLKLILIITLIICTYMFSNIYNIAEKFTVDFDKVIPNFVLENGVLNADERAEYSIENGILILDTNYSAEELKSLSGKEIIGYDYNILISKDGMNVYVSDMLLAAMEFQPIIGKYTKQSFYNNILKPFGDISVKSYFFVISYIAIFSVYILLKFSNILTVMILATIFNILFGNRLKFSDIFKIAPYVLTLPIIIETIALVVVGSVSESVMLIYQLLMSIYVFYALRAIKLDKIILTATQNGILKKIVNNEGIHDEKQNNLEQNEIKENQDNENKED